MIDFGCQWPFAGETKVRLKYKLAFIAEAPVASNDREALCQRRRPCVRRWRVIEEASKPRARWGMVHAVAVVAQRW